MKKKYLKTIEDVVALKDTDTKIYVENENGYYRFVNGVWCAFDDDGAWSICPITCEEENLYIYEEEPMQEATEEDVGKMCLFYDTEADEPRYSILEKVFKEDSDFPFMDSCCDTWEHCRRLTPSEVAEITGYGVTEDGSTFYGEPFKVVGKEK